MLDVADREVASEGSQVIRVKRIDLRDGRQAWTVLRGFEEVEPAAAFLRQQLRQGRSPNTLRSYASDLRHFFAFLDAHGLNWSAVGLDEVSAFVDYLLTGDANVLVLHGLGEQQFRREISTVERALSAVMGFYDYHRAVSGVLVAEQLRHLHASPQGQYKGLLYGLTKTARSRQLAIRLKKQRTRPKTLTISQVAAILRTQTTLRDRLIFCLLFETGMRQGQLLGLRHEDLCFAGGRNEVHIVERENDNGARGKGSEGVAFVSPTTVRLYGRYMADEYGDLDSDYVLVNLWGGEIGAPMTRKGLESLLNKTRKRVGFHFTPHQFRHTFVTLAKRSGVDMTVISQTVTHASTQTTQQMYLHLEAEDLKRELEKAGVLDKVRDLL